SGEYFGLAIKLHLTQLGVQLLGCSPYACAGLRIQFNGGLQCRLYAGYGVAAIRQTGGSLAVAMPGGATLARAYGSSSMAGSSAVCRPGKA
ncbi:hypothetical protein DMP40_15980, partial [Klebsiella pneumoniae]